MWRRMRDLNSANCFGEKHISARGGGASQQKIEEGNMAKDSFGVNNIFLTFILAIMVLMFMTVNTEFARAEWEFYEDIGAGVELCENIKTRLNSYAWEYRYGCTWDVVASYPDFKELPWENLDPKKHEEFFSN